MRESLLGPIASKEVTTLGIFDLKISGECGFVVLFVLHVACLLLFSLCVVLLAVCYVPRVCYVCFSSSTMQIK